jgi:hypothetical protein
MTFSQPVQHLQDGELVNASVVGRPDRQLELALNRVQTVLDSATAGQKLVVRNAVVASDVLAGAAVFYNTQTQRYENALAQTSFDAATGVPVAATTAEVVGIVERKLSSTEADIVVTGVADLDLFVDGEQIAGPYYLSATTPGQLTTVRSTLSVLVCLSLSPARAFVCPTYRAWAEDHTHYAQPLICAPAGDAVPPGSGLDHEITGADDEFAGWLPADHPIFDGAAPEGAEFGYNLTMDPETARLWPPFPLEAASLVWDRGGAEFTGGVEIPAGTGGLVQFTSAGIWWMTKVNGFVPWDPEQTFVNGEPTDSEDIGFPPRQMRLTLYCNRVLYEARRTAVTSLTTPPNSVLTIRRCDGTAGSTGDLEINADLALVQSNTTITAGHIVVKGVTNNVLVRGPVTEGVRQGAGNVTVTSTNPRTTNDGVVHQGIVTISVPTDPAGRELLPQVTVLSDTRETTINGVPAIELPVGYASEVIYKLDVPSIGLSSPTTISLNLWFYGSVAGSFPTLIMTRRVVVPPTTTPGGLSVVTSSLTQPSMSAFSGAGQYVRMTIPDFTVTAGSSVAIRVGRSVSDGYSGALSILRISGIAT